MHLHRCTHIFPIYLCNSSIFVYFLPLSILIIILYTLFKKRGFFLLEFATYKSSKNLVSKSDFIDILKSSNHFSDESIEFQKKILAVSGLGDSTPLPPHMTTRPPSFSYNDTLKSALETMYSTVSDLFSKISISLSSISHVIVTSSFLVANPSLAHHVINHFGLVNAVPLALVGAGCAEGLIAVDIAQSFLQSKRGRVLIVSVQPCSVTYLGNQRSMLIPNCLFRLGCSAVLVSNLKRDASLAKFDLIKLYRNQKHGISMKALELKEDEDQNFGFFLSFDLLEHYMAVIKQNLKSIAPFVFSTRELVTYVLQFLKYLINPHFTTLPSWPSFSQGATHFCLHPGGRGVLNYLEKSLDLTPEQCEPSRFVLERYGNVSGCSVWYCLDRLRGLGKITKGDTVWQIGYGSGMEAVSIYWRAR
ncbi:hypothetical protein RCL1_001382 [Eukaryota sp. TZLM3-RCL]